MKTRLFLTLNLLFVSVMLSAQDYSDFKTVFTKWGDVMTSYNEKMADCSDISKLASYCTELADSITVLTPDLKDVVKKYPEIFSGEPPAELKDFVSSQMEISQKFNTMISGLTKFANDNPENEVFQTAFGKLNTAVYYMMR